MILSAHHATTLPDAMICLLLPLGFGFRMLRSPALKAGHLKHKTNRTAHTNVLSCRLTGTSQQFPRALEILSQHFKENTPRERPGSAPPAIAALLARPGTLAALPPHPAITLAHIFCALQCHHCHLQSLGLGLLVMAVSTCDC